MLQALKRSMKPEQLMEQVGNEAYMTGLAIEDAMRAAGGDMEKAGAIFISLQQAKADRPPLQWKNRPDTRDLAEDLAEIMEGNADNSDPAMNGWFGRQVRGKTAMFTTQLEYEYNNAYGSARAQGLSDESAREYAKNTVAAGTKVFGNELIWTGGVKMQNLIGMDQNATPEQMDAAWELVCTDLDLDPDAVRFKMAGPYAVIVGDDGLPVHGNALIPRELFGERYRTRAAKEAQEQQTKDAQTRATDIATRNRHLELMFNLRHGAGNDHTEIMPGVTIGDYRYANEDERTRIRSMYETANRGVVGRVLKHIYDEIQAVREDPSSDPYRDRWKTKSWAYSPDGNLMDFEQEGEKLRQAAESNTVKTTAPQAAQTATAEGGEVTATETKIMQHEGFRGKPYKDSVGVKTVGYGRNLKAHPITEEEWAAIGGKRDLSKKPLTKQEATVLFKNDMARANQAVDKLVPGVEMSDARRGVLTNMAFNLGETRLRGFEKMLAAVRAGDWDTAAREMLYNSPKEKTKWHRQVGKRARELAAILRKG